MNAVASKPKATHRKAAGAPPAGHIEPGLAYVRHQTLGSIRDFIEYVLGHEHKRGDNSGLVIHQMRFADDACARVTTPTATLADFEKALFEIEAAFVAAYFIPDDSMPDEERECIAHALGIIDKLTDFMMGGGASEAEVDAAVGDLTHSAWTAQKADAAAKTDEAERIRIAGDANYQIGKLAEMLKAHYMKESTEEWPIYHGILGRIEQLSEVVFYAMRLGGTDHGATFPSNKTLRGFLDGHFGLIVEHEA